MFKRDEKIVRLFWFHYVELGDGGDYVFDTRRLDSLKIHDILSQEIKIVNSEGNIEDILEVKVILGRPGLLIGKGGRDINALEKHLSEKTGRKVEILVEEFDLWELRHTKIK